jgi:hypothetical protein
MNADQLGTNFRAKYDLNGIYAVGVDEENGIINVYTTDAKIWVDLPAKYEGYEVKMKVGRGRVQPLVAR